MAAEGPPAPQPPPVIPPVTPPALPVHPSAPPAQQVAAPAQPIVPLAQPIQSSPMLQLNWSHFEPKLIGKPDKDMEAHLLRTNDWMDTNAF